MTTLVLTEVITTEQDRKVVIDQNLINYVNKAVADANVDNIDLPCIDEEYLKEIWTGEIALNIDGNFRWDRIRFVTFNELVKYVLEWAAYEDEPHNIWSEGDITSYEVEED